MSYTLDAADRVTGVTTTPYRGTAQTAASSIAHKPYGGIASMTYGSGLARSVGYDQQYRINSIVTGAVQNLAYTHDANGNITKITDAINPTKTKTFGYDPLDRLTSAAGPWGSLSWTYDGVGNRQTQVENGATSTYSYQTGTNKLTGVTGPSPLTFSLDANGNTTAENAKTYTFNQNNRLIKASEASTLGEYSFNANGQRATKTASGSTTAYHHDQQGNLIAETTSAGATVGEYVWLEGQPLAKLDTGGTRYIHPDHLGTPQLMTGSTGAKVWEIEAKPFGDGASITGSALLNLRFPGQYYDSETGLHQNWFRDYMPKVGRYVEPDLLNIGPLLARETFIHLGPILARVQSTSQWARTVSQILAAPIEQITQHDSVRSILIARHAVHPPSQHHFTYVLANPLRYKDPFGLAEEDCKNYAACQVYGGIFCLIICAPLAEALPAMITCDILCYLATNNLCNQKYKCTQC